MEALYEGMTQIPTYTEVLEGAILLILVVGVLIFGVEIPPPKK